MWSDKFDKKIIEAAENHHPAYDEKAWNNMEKLLDKHLPQEKKRRSGFMIFLLFFGLLGGAGLWYLLDNNNENKVSIAPSAISKASKSNDNVEDNSVVTNVEKEKDNNLPSQTSSNVIMPPNNISFYSGNKKVRQSESLLRTNKVLFNKSRIENSIEGNRYSGEEKVNDQHKRNDSFVKDQYLSAAKQEPVIKQGEGLSKKLEESNDSVNLVDSATKNEIAPIFINDEKHVSEKKERSTNQKNNFFFLSLSAGPDISYVSADKAGAVKIVGGAGIGYSMKNGLSFRAGFYSGRKVYTASPEAYHPPSGFTQYYPILENIAADCLIYEIPLSVSYNFKTKTKTKGNWFAGAGVSSIIMKSEKYSFDYKYSANGPSYKGNWSVNNENKHYFSIFTLSGGYLKQLTKTVSLSAEPYLKIPLQGVGYGNVNLNSAGVLFTLSVKPFNSGK